MASSDPILPQGAGYGVGKYSFLGLFACIASHASCTVIGIGLFFSVFMVGLTAIQSRYTGFSPKNSEEFNSASRSVKPGLIASGIVSAWTWAATLVRHNVAQG